MPLSGFPCAVDVAPAATHAAASRFVGLEPEVAANEPQLGTLRLCDRFGNPRRHGGDKVQLLVRRDAHGPRR